MKLEETLIRSIEEQAWIDEVADPVQGALRTVLDRTPRLSAFLHGTWLGHPLHAALVAVPVGAFTLSMIFDGIEVFGKTRKYQRAADTSIAVGLAGAVTAVLPGLADWSLTTGGAKRVGFVHATLNTTIAGLYGASLIARSRRRRGAGIALATIGHTLLIASAWLGGELAYRYGVGVRPGAKPVSPEPVAESATAEA